MHSYLLIGTDVDKINLKIEQVCNDQKGKLIEYECKTIENIRELKHFVNLSSNEKMLIYLPRIDEASEAAQNALLKTIEEPQKNIIFVLTAEIEDKVLETIRSRCEVLHIHGSISEDSIKIFNEFIDMSPGERLNHISKITKREEAVTFLKQIIEGGSTVLKQDQRIYSVIEQAQLALDRIRGNGNVQLQLTNFVVQGLS